MFRPVNRSSSGHQSNKSKVLLRYWDPNIYNYIQYKIWYWIKYVVKFFSLMPQHVLMKFRGFPPGCGNSVADF